MSDDRVDELLRVCRLGSVEEIQAIVSESPQLINVQEPRYLWSPLYRSVIAGHEHAVQYLLQEGADPDIATLFGERPLHEAADGAKHRVAQLLFEFNASPDVTQNDGNTPLHLAVMKGHTTMVDLLLSHGSSPDLQNKGVRRTPLHYAAELGHSDIVQLLLISGASSSLEDNEGLLPVQLATDTTVIEAFRELSPSRPKKLRTPLTLLDHPDPPLSEATVHEHSPTSSGLSSQCSVAEAPSVKEETKTNHPRSGSSVNEPEAERVVPPLRHLRAISQRDQKPGLRHWLVSYRLDGLYESLLDSGYDDVSQMAAQLSSSIPLDEEVLKHIGIRKSGHRRRLLGALFEETRTCTTLTTQRKPERASLFACCTSSVPSGVEVRGLPTLERWLANLNLEEYHQAFVDNGYEELEEVLGLMHTPWALTDAVLTEIGVTKIGHRHRILSRLDEDSPKIDSMRRAFGGFSTRRRRDEIAMARQTYASGCCLM